MDNKNLTWQPLLSSEIDAVDKIANLIHTTLPERPEVFAEKLILFPEGCRKLVLEEKIVGYGFSHPWMLNSIPPLDEFLKKLPANPECIYIHDVVILPEARGFNSAANYVDHIKQIATAKGIPYLTLVSVYGTDTFWNRFGFRIVKNLELSAKLASYGPTAKYMSLQLV